MSVELGKWVDEKVPAWRTLSGEGSWMGLRCVACLELKLKTC